MANALKMKIATLESLLVTSAECPCTNGYIGILPGHAPLVGALGAGTLSYIPVGASSLC